MRGPWQPVHAPHPCRTVWSADRNRIESLPGSLRWNLGYLLASGVHQSLVAHPRPGSKPFRGRRLRAQRTTLMDPTIDVIIVNWDTGHQLRDCLSALSASQRSGYALGRVIVVDNASSDGSANEL